MRRHVIGSRWLLLVSRGAARAQNGHSENDKRAHSPVWVTRAGLRDHEPVVPRSPEALLDGPGRQDRRAIRDRATGQRCSMNHRIPEFTGLFADLLERSYIGKTRLRSGRGCARHRLPRTRCPRAAGIRSERMLKATEEEHRAPAAAAEPANRNETAGDRV